MSLTPADFLTAERILRRPAWEPFERYQSLVEAARAFLPVDAFYLCRFDRVRGLLDFVYSGEDELYGPGQELPLGEGPTSQVVRSGRPVLVGAEGAERPFPMNPFGDRRRRSGSALHVPMWIDVPEGGVPDGVLSVQAHATNAYGSEALAAIEWLALRASSFLAPRAPDVREERS